DANAAAQFLCVGKVGIGLHHFAPRRDHATIGYRAVRQREDVNGIVVGMQTRDPARPAPAHRQSQLGSVAPLLWASLDLRQLDLSLADTLQRIPDDRALRIQL